MGRFVKGKVIVLPFPFSDLSASKRRPALVIAPLQGDDVILCMITSRAVKDSYAVSLARTDFVSSGFYLDKATSVPTGSHIIPRSIGKLSDAKMQEVINAIVNIIQA